MFTRCSLPALSALTLLALCVLPACHMGSGDSVFTSPSSIVERRAHADLECYDGMRVVESGGGAFTATGCGRRASYVCTLDRVNGRLCMREGDVVQTGETSGGSVEADRGIEQGRFVAELAAVSPRVERCLTRPGLALTITLGASGNVTRIAGAIATAQEQECIEGVLAGVRVTSLPTPAEVVTSFPPPRPLPAPPSAARAAAPAAPSALGPWVDAHIAQNRDAILACVARAVVAVRVESDAGGVRWLLQGDLAGSPEQECVASVMTGSTPPAPRGTAIRVVR